MMKLSSGWKEVSIDYKIQQFIGKGTYGQVMQAIHRASGKEVAIKMIECSLSNLNAIK